MSMFTVWHTAQAQIFSRGVVDQGADPPLVVTRLSCEVFRNAVRMF